MLYSLTLYIDTYLCQLAKMSVPFSSLLCIWPDNALIEIVTSVFKHGYRIHMVTCSACTTKF